ncbi:MAG: hypothetical protein WManBPW_04550 [Shewanella algae]
MVAKLSLQIMIVFLPYTRVGYDQRRTKGLCNIGWAVFWGFTKGERARLSLSHATA